MKLPVDDFDWPTFVVGMVVGAIVSHLNLHANGLLLVALGLGMFANDQEGWLASAFVAGGVVLYLLADRRELQARKRAES